MRDGVLEAAREAIAAEAEAASHDDGKTDTTRARQPDTTKAAPDTTPTPQHDSGTRHRLPVVVHDGHRVGPWLDGRVSTAPGLPCASATAAGRYTAPAIGTRRSSGARLLLPLVESSSGPSARLARTTGTESGNRQPNGQPEPASRDAMPPDLPVVCRWDRVPGWVPGWVPAEYGGIAVARDIQRTLLRFCDEGRRKT